MFPETEANYQKLLTEVLQKLMTILGSAITLAKARNVKGLIITDEGTVTGVAGTHEETTQKLIAQFNDLSEPLVKHAMQPLLTYGQTQTPLPAPTEPNENSEKKEVH